MEELNLAFLQSLFKVDELSIIMLCLVGFVAINIAVFSRKYLAGDSAQRLFFARLMMLISCVFVMVTSDNLVLFFVSWTAGNYLLTRLMIHKSKWQAAKESGRLALRNFAFGSVLLATAFGFLYIQTGTMSIHQVLQQDIAVNWLAVIVTMLFLSAMTQSAIWPFHRWLISSLNSPTPVSAIMHAGLINGGGFLLARFAPLLIKTPVILEAIFFIGLATALMGTLWKLMQNDIKRMLACSTMGQMGFMIVQCGLGLFPAAIAHLCWHGLFKAYLFLSSGSAAQEKRLDLDYPPTLRVFFLSLLAGAGAAYAFAFTSHKSFAVADTTLFLIGIAFLAGAQLAIPLLKNAPWKRLPLVLVVAAFAGSIYGLSVYAIEALLAPLHLMAPQPLRTIHIIGFAMLAGSWLLMLFGRRNEKATPTSEWVKRTYVQMLNASQPHAKTVTAHHNHYQY